MIKNDQMEVDYSILRIHLVDSVPAYEFSKLTSLVNDIYDTFLWVEDVRGKGFIPFAFHPNEEERLYIKKAAIGTPNVVEFMGIAEHLINTAKFLAENYNTLLTISNAALITIEKTRSIADFMNKVKSIFDATSFKENNADRVTISGNRSLEEELMKLEYTEKLDKETFKEKNNFMNYVKNIGQVSENIIVDVNLIIVKSE